MTMEKNIPPIKKGDDWGMVQMALLKNHNYGIMELQGGAPVR